ncbi:MAG: glycosyltransferase [Sandaracinaceae bacterium]|nr:glycosyltransferase [Sandaracinaceae bacterium]
MARVCLVVPCFNESARLRGDDFLRASLPGHELHFRFVDDGSTDGTATSLARLATIEPDRVRCTLLPRNVGKGEAVRAGMGASLDDGHDYLGFWDADLATPLEELAVFVETLERRPQVDLVLGARVALLGRHIDRRLYRHAYGRVFASAVSQLLGLAVYDTQCGAKLFRVDGRLRAVLNAPFLSRWIFDVEILARYIAQYEAERVDPADRIVEVPLRVWTDVAGSKVGIGDAARAFVELARIGRRYDHALSARRVRRER